MLDLSKIHTRKLISMLRENYGCYEKTWSTDDLKQIREELKRREHIPTKAQSVLIRKMSQKAGKRLTLRQAQLMANKEKKK